MNFSTSADQGVRSIFFFCTFRGETWVVDGELGFSISLSLQAKAKAEPPSEEESQRQRNRKIASPKRVGEERWRKYKKVEHMS